MNAQAAAQTAAAAMAEVNKRLAPAVVANLQTNADQVSIYLMKHNLEFTADNVVAAVWVLHAEGEILWLVDPVAADPNAVAREKKAKDKARADAEDAKFKPGARHVDDIAVENLSAADKAKQIATAKELQSLKDEITREIRSYRKGSHLGIENHSGTEAGQSKLRNVAGDYQKLTSVDEEKRVLQNVRAAKAKLS